MESFCLRKQIKSPEMKLNYSVSNENGVFKYYKHENGVSKPISRDEVPSNLIDWMEELEKDHNQETNDNSRISNVEYTVKYNGDVPTYYKYENGMESIISAEEVPTFILKRLQKYKKQPEPVKKTKKSTYVLICALVICLYFFVRVKMSDNPSNFEVTGVIISLIIIDIVVFFKFISFLVRKANNTTIEKQIEEIESEELPVPFEIKSYNSTFYGIMIYVFIYYVVLIAGLVLSIYNSLVTPVLVIIVMLVSLALMYFKDLKTHLKNRKVYIEISGQRLTVYNGDELIGAVARDLRCVFKSSNLTRRRTVPVAIIYDNRNNLIAEVALTYKDYLLLKRYLNKNGAIVEDMY